MNDPKTEQNRYNKAKKRVEDEKRFYNHLIVYIIINIVIFVVNMGTDRITTDQNFTEWLDWNLFITPVLWGIGLAIHGLRTFRKNAFFSKTIFSKEWEERKIKELMDEDDF
ncbi:2TM domain-containing protein [Aquimarina sp. I32.4]|uniref:2TM domain-containing protein n=1 Tax=Aquimarina sp. I32.4 TaxID=2053903 RepID=UPI000CDEBF1C|nr:2TM domain-containing protein [Aquimarina sp. I32.4]